LTASAPAFDTDSIRLQWREARGGIPSTATMNLIVYVENEAYRDWVFERAWRIADKHPSRMIVLDAIKDHHGTKITAQEPHQDETPQIFREGVELGVDGVRAPQRVQFVEALLVKEIPCVLWWAAERLFSSETFAGLLKIVEHVILDSSGTNTDTDALREFASYFSGKQPIALGDLAWMRLDPWRDVIAQFFDDPSMRDELFSIRRVAITSGSESEALYLGCWLASRLGWKVRDGSTFVDANGSVISFERKREGEIRRVKSVRLETATSSYSAHVEGETVSLEVTGRFARAKRVVPLQAIDNTSLVERAILGDRTDEIFIEALQTVGDLLK
jgi:glucose-6-phosphate dehydrogenase assembly protein OpcA